jgi:hypothetical protein
MVARQFVVRKTTLLLHNTRTGGGGGLAPGPINFSDSTKGPIERKKMVALKKNGAVSPLITHAGHEPIVT